MGKRLVYLEVGSRVITDNADGYRVIFGGDRARVVYPSAEKVRYAKYLDPDDSSRLREGIESMDIETWHENVQPCPDEERTWELVALFDDGPFVECSGSPDCIPGYQALLEILMSVMGDIEEE